MGCSAQVEYCRGSYGEPIKPVLSPLGCPARVVPAVASQVGSSSTAIPARHHTPLNCRRVRQLPEGAPPYLLCGKCLKAEKLQAASLNVELFRMPLWINWGAGVSEPFRLRLPSV